MANVLLLGPDLRLSSCASIFRLFAGQELDSFRVGSGCEVLTTISCLELI
jgi:hypothetical protein